MAPALRRPNVLFLLSDQHSPHALGAAGNGRVRTPNLDRLAGEGMSFDQAYCQNPLCVPSRASLITGRYSRDLGVYDNRHVLESNGVTMPRVLAAAGYRTCLIGKAHLNGEQWQGYQQRPYGDLYGQAHQPNPSRLAHPGSPAGLGGLFAAAGPLEIPMPLTQTEICVAESVKWLQAHVGSHPDQPFFLSVHFDKPHFPFTPPQHYFDGYAGRVDVAPPPDGDAGDATPFVRMLRARFEEATREDRRRALAAYYGCVEWVDDAVGRILDSLAYLGLAEDTLVVYSSDHGEMAGEHGLWQKSVFYEASVRVPLVVRRPGHVRPGSRSGAIAGLIDLFPSFCDVAGCPAPESCDGVSLRPVWEGGGAPDREALFSETVMLNQPEQAGCMVRAGRWKYCAYLDGAEELYDLREDAGETVNVVTRAEHEHLARELRDRVREFWRPEEQLERYRATPRMKREKHFYEFSNQFVLGDGTVVDARP